MIDLGTPQSRNNKSLSGGRPRTASSSDGDENSVGTAQTPTKDQPIDAPRTKLIITSYSRSPDGSTVGSDTFGHSADSGARKRTTRIVESSLDSLDSVTFLGEEAVPEDEPDDMTIDSTMRAIEESLQFSKSRVSKAYQDKPLPGYIKLRKDVDAGGEQIRQESGGNYGDSLSSPAVVHSAHTMHGKMTLRRGQTGSNYHDALPMTERARATSPVSGTLERLRIRGFKEPPRDYVQHHKLTPIDHQQELKRYGYGKSPAAKSEALAEVIEMRYSDKNMKQLQVVESPLTQAHVDRVIRVPLYPGSPKSQHAEALEREAAERARSRQKVEKQKHKSKKSSSRGLMSAHHLVASSPSNGRSIGLNDSMDESEVRIVKAGGDSPPDTAKSSAGYDDGEEREGEEDEEGSVLSDHENFDLDAHLDEAFEAMEEEAQVTTTGATMAGTENLDLHSSQGGVQGDGGVEAYGGLADVEGSGSVSRGGSHRGGSVGGRASVTTANTGTATTTSSKAREVLGETVHGQILAVKVAREKDSVRRGGGDAVGAGVEDHLLAGLGSQTTGFALSQGSGFRQQSEQPSSLKVKQTPAQRRRMKLAQEKKVLKEQGGSKHIVIAPHGRNIDYFRLKNPTKTSASARDPRPGALPHFASPYYEPKTYRLPESLEDRLNNINQEDEDRQQLDHFLNQESSLELLMSQLPSQEQRDPHAWRRPFLGGKKIKFADAQDTDEENEFGIDSQADDFEFSIGGSSVGGESQAESLGGGEDEDGGEGEGEEGVAGAPGRAPSSQQMSRSASDRGRSVQGTRPGIGSTSQDGAGAGGSQLMNEVDVGQDSLLTTSQADDTSLAGGGGGGGALLEGEHGPINNNTKTVTDNSQAPTQSEFVPINVSPEQEGFFPGADPSHSSQAGLEQNQTLGVKTKDPFFQQEEAREEGEGSVGNSAGGGGRVSPSGSVSRGLSASISLVRASMDDTKGNAIAPPNTNSSTTGAGHAAAAAAAAAGLLGGGGGAHGGSPLSLTQAVEEGVSQEPSGLVLGGLDNPHGAMGVIGITGASGVIPGGDMDNSLMASQSLEGVNVGDNNTGPGVSPLMAGADTTGGGMQALFHPSSVSGAGTGADNDDNHSSGAHSMSSSVNAREAMRKRAEQEEMKKKRQKERAIAKLRAQQLAKLQEEQSKKTLQFIQNHADPNTAKRTDYKFPDHGIQKPGVGEARVRHRDYAYDSMYLHHDGSMRSQKDEGRSSLLETVHLDVRLKSPAAGSRPLTPGDREAREREHMFKFTYTGSFPPTPDQSHRKISHQIQMLEDDLRAHARLQPDPVVRYDANMVLAMPDPNDMSKPDYTTASQRFREEAEEQRERREKEALAAAEVRLKKQEEAEEAALAAAGIKKPKRKKLQKPKKKAAAESIPIAYSVGPVQGGAGGVGASIVPSRVPSRIRKPKLHFSKEARADQTLAGQTLAQEPRFGKGAQSQSVLPEVVSPVGVGKKKSKSKSGGKDKDGGDGVRKKPETEIKISGGVTIFTRDNRALDPEGYVRKEWMKNQKDASEHKHNIWGADFDSAAVARAQLEKNLEKAMVIEKRTPSSDGGSGGGRRMTIVSANGSGGSRGSRRGTVLGMNGSPPGSPEGSVNSATMNMPSPGRGLGQESTLSLHSGGGLGTMAESPDMKLNEEGEEEEEGWGNSGT